MLLILTNGQDATANYLCDRLRAESVHFVRFDTDGDLTTVSVRYGSGRPAFTLQGTEYTPDKIHHIWYRRPRPLRPALEGSSSEIAHAAQEWSEAIEGVLSHVPAERWMNHPARNTSASHKIEQLTRAGSVGLRVPQTLVTQDPEEFRSFWTDCDGDVVVKPLASGYIERNGGGRDSVIYTERVTLAHLDNMESLRAAPTLFQRRVRKREDVRVCIVDDEVVPVSLRIEGHDGEQPLDIRRDDMAGVRYEPVELPADVRRALLRLVRAYGLRFSAIDMAIDSDGNWVFFELNPNGQWAWLDQLGGTDIAGSFVRAFSPAC
jgi:hypothetical protein